MRFTLRTTTSPNAIADAILLKTMGLPSGGIVSVGNTHVRVIPGEVDGPNVLLLNQTMFENAELVAGANVEVKRAVLPQAEVVRFAGPSLTTRSLAAALHGMALTTGDRIRIDGVYTEDGRDVTLDVVTVGPSDAGLAGAHTRYGFGSNSPTSAVQHSGDGTVASPVSKAQNPSTTNPSATKSGAASSSSKARKVPVSSSRSHTSAVSSDVAKNPNVKAAKSQTSASAPVLQLSEALLAGLDNEVELMAGWFSLLASSHNLSTAWNLPAVAGVMLEGPNGCGKSELVTEAARRANTTVTEVDVSRVFKPERLLDRLSAAISSATGPRVIFVDRLETLTGDDALSTFRTQFMAVLRWFLEEVAQKPQVICVLGVNSVAELHSSIAKSPLLPRTVSIPPPDLNRRQKLFEAGFAYVPGSAKIDFARLAALSSGFSGSDVLASILHCAADVARGGGFEQLNTDMAIEAVEATTPSLGSVPMGQISGFGFEKVANMADVKQRLTEAVIWPMTQPERYARLGIEPPKGILLWGPPGTGKTFVVKALAHEAGCAFFAVKGAELLDKFVGESERAVRNVFARARDAAPSIIFFDEFDALAPVRGRGSSSVSDQVVAALLTEIDGVADRGQVSVIAATNRKDLIDSALLRAGRFESHIEIGLPATEARLALLNITDVNLDEEVDLQELAELTEGLSFADLTGLLREAALATLRSDDAATAVKWPALQSALALFEERRQQ